MSVTEDIFDTIRYIIPYYFFLILPLFIILSPIDPVKAAQEFTAYRLQQYDIQGVKIGSRSSAFSLEAQTSYSKLLSRKCLLLKLLEVSVASIRMAIAQNVGSVVILLPERASWDTSLKEHVSDLEKELLTEEFSVPIYFAFETPDVIEIYENVRQLTESSKASSATQALAHSITSNGYLLYTGNHKSGSVGESQITNIYGKLPGNGIEEQLPTILVVAHYDSMGMTPSLSFGYDSNGSGVVTLMQLIKVFSRLYALPKSQAKYNLAFLLTGGGKLNYIGTKKWLDDLIEHPDGSLNLDRLSTVVCLERLGLGDGMYVHVSKPPKEGSSSLQFVDALVKSSEALNSSAQLVHKKINLNEDELHWEHERFSFKKISALTLSGQQNRSQSKSILDDHVNERVLVGNVRAVTEAFVRLIYNLDENTASDMVTDEQWISEEGIRADLALITRYPRSQQLMDSKHPLLMVFERVFKRYLQNSRTHKTKADPRDPEFVLYSGTEVTIIAHRVKPAIFDFMIACMIVTYLGLIYLVIENFSSISRMVLKISVSTGTVSALTHGHKSKDKHV